MPAVYAPTNSQVPEISQTVSFAAAAGLFYVVSGSAAVTVTLPTAVGISGTVVRVRCANGYSGLCTIATTSTQTIGPSSATSQILRAGETALVQSDGANWVRTGGLLIPCLCKMYLSPATTSFANNTSTVISLDTVEIDNTARMGNGATGKITVFRSGNYRLIAKEAWAAASTLTYNLLLSINKNTSTGLGQTQNAFGANGFTNFTQTVEIGLVSQLAAGDVLNLVGFQGNSGSGPVFMIGGSIVTFFVVEEILSW